MFNIIHKNIGNLELKLRLDLPQGGKNCFVRKCFQSYGNCMVPLLDWYRLLFRTNYRKTEIDSVFNTGLKINITA